MEKVYSDGTGSKFLVESLSRREENNSWHMPMQSLWELRHIQKIGTST